MVDFSTFAAGKGTVQSPREKLQNFAALQEIFSAQDKQFRDAEALRQQTAIVNELAGLNQPGGAGLAGQLIQPPQPPPPQPGGAPGRGQFIEGDARQTTLPVAPAARTGGLQRNANTDKLFARLAQINPALSKGLQEIYDAGDARLIAQVNREAAESKKLATFFQGIEDRDARTRAIELEMTESLARGDNPIKIQKLNSLLNMTNDEQLNALRKQQIISTDIAKLDRFSGLKPPKLTDVTPKSFEKFQRTGNPADLVATPAGVDTALFIAILEPFLAEADIDDPEQVALAVRKAELIARAAKGDKAALKELRELEAPKQPAAPTDEGPGPIERTARDIGQGLKELAIGLRDSVTGGTPNTEERNAIVKDMISRGLDVQLRRGEVIVNGLPLDEFIAEQENATVATKESVRQAFPNQEPLIDESGFWYVPGPDGTKVFITDAGGNKTKPAGP